MLTLLLIGLRDNIVNFRENYESVIRGLSCNIMVGRKASRSLSHKDSLFFSSLLDDLGVFAGVPILMVFCIK